MKDILSVLQGKTDFYFLPGASNKSIEEAEQLLSVKFTDEYKEYARHFGAMSSSDHELAGVCASPRLNIVDVTLEERENNPYLTKKAYVIEQLNIDDLVVWQSESGDIFLTAANTKPYKLYDSLREYLIALEQE